MPKRRRLLTPMKKKQSAKQSHDDEMPSPVVSEVITPRGRLKGALMDALDLNEDNSLLVEKSPYKRDRSRNTTKGVSSSSEDESSYTDPTRAILKQRYILKLFDRSVDLSQFEEDSPLYPICRAWMYNQPKANYKKLGKKYKEPKPTEDSVELPGPEGPPISRIPELLPEQKEASKDNINLNYREAPPPSREQLLQSHLGRWAGVRRAWLQRSERVERRYRATQDLLNKINVNII